jgi:NitT/TauT family transport system substrate-binding protein
MAVVSRANSDYGRFVDEVKDMSLFPLWERVSGLKPGTQCVPAHWSYAEVRPQLIRACELVTKKEASRRVLCLENPSLRGTTFVCDSLFAGLQIILPGEVAPSHRHTPSALRFIVEGEGAYTAVAGEKLPMKPGDFVVTPAWAWHDHGNHGTAPVVWLDGLDTPFARFFGAAFYEPYPEEKQPLDRPEGESISVYGMNLIPDEFHSDGHSTPVLIYPYERTRAALDSRARGQAASGARLQAALRQSRDRQASVPDHGGVDAATAAGICRSDLSLDRQRGVRRASRRGRCQGRRAGIQHRPARRVRRAAVAALQLRGDERARAVQLFGPRRAGGARLLPRAGGMMWRVLAVAAVALSAATTPLSAQPLEDVTMALPAVGFPFTAGYVADGLGLWEKNGLRVKSIVIAGVGSTNAVISGSADFGQISGLSLTRAAAKGQRLLALVNTFDKPFVEISIRKEIADAAGFDPNAPLAKRAQILKGHTFAVGGINSVVHAYLRIIALIGGLDPETIRVTAMAGDNMLAAMQTKTIDGISTVLPWPRKPVVEGTAVLVASGSRNDPPHLVPLAFNVLATRPETCEKRKSLCEKMGRTFSEAMAYIRDNPQGLFALLKKQFSNFDDAVLTASVDIIRRSTPQTAAVPVAALENADNFNVEARLMKPDEKLKSYDGLYTDAYVK